LRSYIDSPRYGKAKFPIFDYSLIRQKGEPIKGFGGKASGPEPLQKLHSRVESYLDALCAGRLQTTAKSWKELKNSEGVSEWKEVDCEVDKKYDHTRFVADVFNSIGACVVAGNVRRCLPSNALVHTKDGLVQIKDIEIGTEVLTSNYEYRKVSDKFHQGKQELIKIVTQDGEFRCTPNHKMAVCTSYNEYKWVETSALVNGDRLLSSRCPIEGVKTVLPEWEYEKSRYNTTCKDITIPQLDSDMAWLIGLFHGDGYTYPNYDKNGYNAYVNLVFGLSEENIAEKARTQLKRFGENLHITLKKRNNENSLMVHCQSKQLAWYFDKNVKQARKEIRIPEYILKATIDVKLAYVAVIVDSDGSTNNRPIQVVSTVYENFARDIQNLLYSCGIESRLNICTEEYPSRDGWQKIHQLNLITLRSQKLLSEIPELVKIIKKNTKSQNANGFPNMFENNPKIAYKLYE
jgi:DNA-binding protein